MLRQAFLSQFDRPKKKKGASAWDDGALYDALDELDEEDEVPDEEEEEALNETDEEWELADAEEIEELAMNLEEVPTTVQWWCSVGANQCNEGWLLWFHLVILTLC